MDPRAPAEIKNPADYGATDESGDAATEGNFWDSEYQPTDHVDDIPLAPKD